MLKNILSTLIVKNNLRDYVDTQATKRVNA